MLLLLFGPSSSELSAQQKDWGALPALKSVQPPPALFLPYSWSPHHLPRTLVSSLTFILLELRAG